MLMFMDLGVMLLVGGGVIGAVSPDRHLRRWTDGRWPLSKTGNLLTRRRLLRAAALAEAGVGVYMAVRLPAPQR